MKYRKDFVTNSSSSSYVCEICGRSEEGMDLSLSDAEMVNCVNGHTICEDEMLVPDKATLIKEILMHQDDECYTEESLAVVDEDRLLRRYLRLSDMRWAVGEECCPICQFIEYSQCDLALFLEKEYKVSRDEVFAAVKAVNKRRKKLYDSEYVTAVCTKFGLNPTEVVASWKQRFGTYRRFNSYIRGW